MDWHKNIPDVLLRSKIRSGEICFAGNVNLKIYGLLRCACGKRMKRVNRVFFRTEGEALEQDYRPCGCCLKAAYKRWKEGKRVHGQCKNDGSVSEK